MIQASELMNSIRYGLQIIPSVPKSFVQYSQLSLKDNTIPITVIHILKHPATTREAKKRGRGRRHNWSGETFVLMTIYLVTPKQRFEPLSFPLA